MKNLSSKKILIVSVISALAIGMPIFINPIFAAGAYFNTDSLDKPILRTGNYSTNGPSCTTCWSGSTMANTGDIVSFDIYYHNASADTATQTRVKANIPGGNFNSFTVSADLYASNATAITGTSLISLSSTQNLTFINGSVKWYPNQSATPIPLLYGQSGNEIITTTGLNIGDVSAGWATQGHITFRAQVGGGQQQGQMPTNITNSATSINQNNATLNASINPNNSNTNTWFEYGTTQNFGSIIGSQTIGSGNTSINISTYLSNLLSNTTYYYRVVASNSYGTSYGNISSFTTSFITSQFQSGSVPIVITNSAILIYQNSATLNALINPNNSNTNTWFEYGTTQNFGYSSASQSVGSGNFSVNTTGYISGLLSNTTYYYRAVASNQYGTVYGNTLSFTTSFITINQSFQGLMPITTTNSANVFYTNSILLNGAVNANGAIATAWFEYGTTQSLGQITNSQPMGMGTIAYNYSYILSNLTPNTIYYFRAVARNAYGTNYGTIFNFISPVATIAAITTNNTTVNNTSLTTAVRIPANLNSLAVVLVSNVDKSEVIIGDEINYTVVYKNIGNSSVADAKINIILPKGVEYQSANVNPSAQSGQNITFNIGKIFANGQGSASVKIKINNSSKTGELILNADMEYVDNKNINQLAVASSTITVKDNKSNLSLTASLLDSVGSFLESWLFNIILLSMVLGLGIYVIRHLKS